MERESRRSWTAGRKTYLNQDLFSSCITPDLLNTRQRISISVDDGREAWICMAVPMRAPLTPPMQAIFGYLGSRVPPAPPSCGLPCPPNCNKCSSDRPSDHAQECSQQHPLDQRDCMQVRLPRADLASSAEPPRAEARDPGPAASRVAAKRITAPLVTGHPDQG